MEQKEFDEAEAAFKKAAKLDPKFREAQYNLAQIPFKKKDYAKARERFESLFEQTPGGDKNQASQLIKFKIYMILLLEGKESRAQAMMEQFHYGRYPVSLLCPGGLGICTTIRTRRPTGLPQRQRFTRQL
jgi:Tfp pilus assembly protein PilF